MESPHYGTKNIDPNTTCNVGQLVSTTLGPYNHIGTHSLTSYWSSCVDVSETSLYSLRGGLLSLSPENPISTPTRTRRPLYSAFKALREGPEWASLTATQQRIVNNELRDFVLGGVALEVREGALGPGKIEMESRWVCSLCPKGWKQAPSWLPFHSNSREELEERVTSEFGSR